jgi:hypothetical protein
LQEIVTEELMKAIAFGFEAQISTSMQSASVQCNRVTALSYGAAVVMRHVFSKQEFKRQEKKELYSVRVLSALQRSKVLQY